MLTLLTPINLAAISSAADPHTVERARARVTRWSALPDERPCHPGPGLLGLPGSVAGGMASHLNHSPTKPFGNSISESSGPRRRHSSNPAFSLTSHSPSPPPPLPLFGPGRPCGTVRQLRPPRLARRISCCFGIAGTGWMGVRLALVVLRDSSPGHFTDPGVTRGAGRGVRAG